MKITRLTIENFRGVSKTEIEFSGHTLLVGGNNVGKSTICEALDLVLEPDRLFRTLRWTSLIFGTPRIWQKTGLPQCQFVSRLCCPQSGAPLNRGSETLCWRGHV